VKRAAWRPAWLAPLVLVAASSAAPAASPFRVEEATLPQIQAALLKKRITTVDIVEQYLARVRAYNGTCVREPEGVLGRVETIASAGQINALSTLNLRPAARAHWGFDARKARSLVDAVDADPAMPDALETARELDAALKSTGKLAGPLHGMVLAIKDQFDTRDMRTTSGADADYANDRPPRCSARPIWVNTPVATAAASAACSAIPTTPSAARVARAAVRRPRWPRTSSPAPSARSPVPPSATRRRTTMWSGSRPRRSS
jgi:hypothetical protein